ncbi:MAG: membrane dipeptidase [Deltaproteobacteria bacterium]|nr:membrane dipeptidase [Deltaproteobacteria bacterium]
MFSPRVAQDHWSGGGTTQQGKQYQEVEYVDGLENPADFPNLIRWLVKHGYADEDIAKVMGGNALRVLKQV